MEQAVMKKVENASSAANKLSRMPFVCMINPVVVVGCFIQQFKTFSH